jgi:voltage-gated potassium channel
MDESTRRLLGISKGEGPLSRMWYWFRRSFSLKIFLIVLAVAILTWVFFAFMRYEIAYRDDWIHPQEGIDIDPYFMSFFWLLGTLAAGYVENPATTGGRILDLVLILVNVVVVSLLISQLSAWFVSMNLKSMFGVSKTKRKIDCIICGWNPISEAAFNDIREPGYEIVIIDRQNRPELSKWDNVHMLLGDPTNPEILKRANIKNAKSIVLAMEEDAEVLLAIHVVRDLNPWINIVAKINNHEHVKIAESAGADHVVSPPSIGGRLLSMFADEPSAVEWVIRATRGEKGVELIEYDVTKDSAFINKTVGDARKEFGDKVKIIGVDTAEGFEKVPGDELRIEAGNKLIMLVDTKRFSI